MSGSCSEVYREKNFQDANLAPSSPLPVASELGNTSLMLLCHPTLTDEEIEKTCAVIRGGYAGSGRVNAILPCV